MKKPNIIGLTGYLGSGKTTAAKILEQYFGYVRVPFAGPLKAMLEAVGVPPDNLYGTPAQKAEPLPMLGGQSARHAMQTLGTEWGRNLIHPDLWLLLWKNIMSAHEFVVVDDVRFPNEADLIRQYDGVVMRVVRGSGEAGSHDSERLIDSIVHDVIVENNGSEHDLRKVLTRLL